MLRRFKSAARVLVRGEARKNRAAPIPELSAEDLADIRAFFPRTKFFIFGHARSGTTLLMRLARLHPEVHCSYQAHFFTRKPLLRSLVDSYEAEEWLTRRSNRWNHGGDLSTVVLRAAADFIMEREAAAEGKPIVGDKSPSSTIHGQSVRDLHSVYPDGRLVYIVRDGRDVLVSERFRNFIEESRFMTGEDRRIMERLRQEPEAFGVRGASIFTEGMIRRVARGWATNVSEVDTEGKRLFGRHYLSLRFEDLLASPVRVMRRLWRFLGARKPGAALEKAIHRELGSNPDEEWQARRNAELSAFLAKGRTGTWRHLLTQNDRTIFKSVAGQALMDWDYETSLDW